MAELVQIHSEVTIRVTAGLQNQDVTNPDAHVPDRLKINPIWPKHMILVKKGSNYYPKEVAEWPSVKALANDKVITIGNVVERTDLSDKEQDDVATAKEAREEFKMGDINTGRRRRRGQTLSDIASEVNE